jgi:glycerol-3-phosphate acyltransferase PlsX
MLLKSLFFGKLSYLIGKSAFKTLKDKMDPRELNGGVFLGLNGLVVKSHGGTDAIGFSKAIEFSLKLSQSKMSKTINSLVSKNI